MFTNFPNVTLLSYWLTRWQLLLSIQRQWRPLYFCFFKYLFKNARGVFFSICTVSLNKINCTLKRPKAIKLH